MIFILDGCDISFIAEAPDDMTVAQLVKQSARIDPYWCACGIRPADTWEIKLGPEIVFDYDNVRKTSDDVNCTIKEDIDE